MLTGPVILTQFGLGCRLALLCVSSNCSFFFHRNISLDERFFFLKYYKRPLVSYSNTLSSDDHTGNKIHTDHKTTYTKGGALTRVCVRRRTYELMRTLIQRDVL
jgi:hypothetical protein